MIAKYKEFFLGIGIAILAVIYGYSATQIQIRVATAIGPRYVPYGLAAICLILGILQMITGWNKSKKYDSEEHDEESKDNLMVFLVFLAIAVYVAVLKTLGFLIATTVLCFLLQIMLCPKANRKYGMFAIVAVISTVIVYFLFRWGLHLMLPVGMLKFLQ
ncbi:MAG: tripartite tricarboxylate transporter TctB family protein [Oscillospiraceae bacterium]